MLWARYDQTGDIPSPLLNRPDITPEIAWYLDAFFLLNSSRQTGMSVGRIPLSEVTNYALVFGTIGDDLKDFCSIISRLDAAYLEWVDKKKPKQDPKKGVARR